MKTTRSVKKVQKLFTRRLFILLLILAQIGLLAWMFSGVAQRRILSLLSQILSIVTALHMLTRNEKSAFKISLIFLLLLFPFFGGILYWVLHYQTETIGFRRRLSRIEKKAAEAYFLPGDDYKNATEALPQQLNQMRYLQTVPGFPVYKNTQTEYFSTGGAMLESMLCDLRAAKKYIFLEYFIIEEGEMWDSILEVLKERAAAGVDVRLIYDDLGCLTKLPVGYDKKIRSYGIRCARFNPFRPFLSTVQNNRDHRKITVIDGKVAYTGGINLADEYINKTIKYGHWKDSAIRLSGDGAWAFAVMFLQMWEFLSKEMQDHKLYFPTEATDCDAHGWIQPYADSPMDKENVGEHIYMQIIQQAQSYLYITTPYLMVDDAMISALKLSAKSGVDVRIITPRKPDKRMVHFTTRSYYRELIGAGVRIYEYTDGFIHSKNFVSDDRIATVGTTNLDFRSLYLHFECGVCLYQTSSVAQVKEDHLRVTERCHEITPNDCRANVVVRLLQDICRLFSPLM